MSKKLRLGAFLSGSGQHISAWQHPNAHAHCTYDIEYFKRLAQTAERGLFDAFFLADSLCATWGADIRAGLSDQNSFYEPVTLFSALSMVTQHLGFIATATTSYEEPYSLARKFASLDHLSAGRAGWNVVTSTDDDTARNFGLSQQDAALNRYARAEEFVDTVTELWDSWEDDVFIGDKASGQYFDPSKVHTTNHYGRFFSVKGPLNIARPPQGYPVIVQAGQSEPGLELAARTAEVVFTAQQNLEEAQAFYRDLKGRMGKFGRRVDELLIMPGVAIYVAPTQEQAQAKLDELNSLINPKAGLALLKTLVGDVDLSAYPLDGPLPDLPAPRGSISRQQLLVNIAREHNFSIRQLYEWIATARGHLTLVGTPTQIVDQLQTWFEQGAADGFNIMPPQLPNSLDDFVELVIPELQRRGLFRTDYEGRTLRENLGLARPQNQFSEAAKQRPKVQA